MRRERQAEREKANKKATERNRAFGRVFMIGQEVGTNNAGSCTFDMGCARGLIEWGIIVGLFLGRPLLVAMLHSVTVPGRSC